MSHWWAAFIAFMDGCNLVGAGLIWYLKQGRGLRDRLHGKEGNG
jgi:hypothetical protein